MPIRCLAIDDEPLALRQLQSMIEKTPTLSLVSACHDAFEAMTVLNAEPVDAIFIDINMPDLNGMDFVKSLSNPPLIVFTTAYSEYAIEGFKVNAVDYLLKPFGMPEFQKAVAKVQRQYDLEHPSSINDNHNPNDNRSPITDNRSPITEENNILFVKSDYRTVRINIQQIRYVEAMSEYLRIYLDNGESLMTLMAMKRLIELLPASNFRRIHRSYIVNMNHVLEFSKLRLKMDAETYLPVSEMYKDEIIQYIESRTIGK